MATELRRSFKEKAKGFSFRIKGRSEPETPPGGLQAVPQESASGTGPQSSQIDTATPPGAGADGGAGASDKPSEPASEGATHFTFNPLSYSSAVPAMRQKATIVAKDSEESETDGGLSRQDSKRKSRQLVQPKGTLTYEVCGNDTLMSIAAKVDSTTSELKKLNKLMTPMVFPGQVIYIPDKEYVVSSPSSESSPTHAPLSPTSDQEGPLSPDTAATAEVNKAVDSPRPAFDIPLIRSASEKSKGPGLAERLKFADSGSGGGVARPLTDSDAKKIDSECHERFIKVNVKHITDGQGVVNGVLLVTPNAIMFDPNLSDPLVVDRGADEYGMIAPMETVISAAMYHDIAAMKRTLLKDDERQDKSQVYHAPHCAMSGDDEAKEDTTDETSAIVEGDTVKEIDPCSCSLKESGETKDPGPDSQQLSAETNANSETPSSEKTSTDIANTTDISSGPDSVLQNKPADTVKLDSTHSLNVTSASDTASFIDKAVSDDATEHAAAAASDASMPDLIKDLQPAAPVNPLEGVATLVVDPGAPPPHEGSITTPAAVLDSSSAQTTSLTPGMQIGSIQYFQYDAENRGTPKGTGGDASPTAPTTSPGAELGSSPRAGEPETSPSQGGILSRTLAPLNSLRSSLPGSPNFSSFVDFSTGLFSRSPDQQGRVKDGLDPLTPEGSHAVEAGVAVGRNSFHPDMNGMPSTDLSNISHKASSKKNKHLSLSDIDVSVQNAVRLEDMPELFRNLDALQVCTCGALLQSAHSTPNTGGSPWWFVTTIIKNSLMGHKYEMSTAPSPTQKKKINK